MKDSLSINLRQIVAAFSLIAAMTSPVLARPGQGNPPGRTTPITSPDPKGPIEVPGGPPPPLCDTRVCGVRTVEAFATIYNYEETGVSAEVLCPDGTVPVGGGAHTYGWVENIHLIANRLLFPRDLKTGDEDFAASPVGWYAEAGKTKPDNQWPSVSVWAICLPAMQP
jgi:hypothetical protein